MADQPELETIQHPVLGPLKFPVDMGPDERNESIQRALLASGKAPPPGPRAPKIDMQPSILGSTASMGPEGVAQGREAAGRSFPGIHGPTKFGENGLPAYQKPTVAEDASGAALVGATLTAPFTGGESLLTRLGLMGAGAGVGSGTAQLARTGTMEPNQTAGDIASYGVAPELAGSALGALAKNGSRLLSAGGSAAKQLPFIRAPLRAALRDWQATSPKNANLAPIYRDATVLNKIPYAGEEAPVENGLQVYRDATKLNVPYAGEEEGAPIGKLGKASKSVTTPASRFVLTPEEADAQARLEAIDKMRASKQGVRYAAYGKAGKLTPRFPTEEPPH